MGVVVDQPPPSKTSKPTISNDVLAHWFPAQEQQIL